MLRVDDLTIDFPLRGVGRGRTFRAVDAVSLHVEPGEIVGVVGESGSGKSSVGLAVCALGVVSSGRIEVAGHDLLGLRGRALRRARADVQMVFQDPHGSLDPRQSVGAGLDELRRLHPERGLERDNAKVLDAVRLGPELLTRLPHQLSGGQAQRVSLARAVLLEPKVLVADEPTSGLDVSVQAQILRLLVDLRDRQSLSMLFISHDLAVVRQLCDRCYVMCQGQVVESGVPATIFDSPAHDYTRRLVAAVPGKALAIAPAVPA